METKTIIGIITEVASVGFSGYTLFTLEERWRKLGDVNGDGVIDQSDLDLINLALGTVAGDPNWNPDADLNGDGAVDIYDVVVCTNHLGSDYRSWGQTQTLLAVAIAGLGTIVGSILIYI